jgi:adenine deaminase
VADLLVVDDLADFHARQVYVRGKLVAENGQVTPAARGAGQPTGPLAALAVDSVNIAWDKVSLRIPARGTRVRVIGAVEHQLITHEHVLDATIREGEAVADPQRDLLKIAVIERHRASGATGLGFIQGMGLQRGAIAGTVAHDHHNLIIIGADDRSMMVAAHAVADMGGGLAVALGDEILALLPLPVAGLMSDQTISEVRKGYDEVVSAARRLGAELHDPFMAMSFKALEVIPKLKLTDQGLVDVEQFKLVELFVP